MAGAYVVFHEAAFRREFQSWNGSVGRYLAAKSDLLVNLGKGSAGFDSGRLVADIRFAKDHTVGGDLEARVGANPDFNMGTGYGLWNHEGTFPHEIRPKTPGGVLKFRSRGMVVYATRVHHPGTKATKFVSQWLNDLF